MLRRTLCLGLVLLTCEPCARAAKDPVAAALEGLSGARALELVTQLAADDMKGRKTAFEGGSRVENWMLDEMSGFGLVPADAAGAYLQPFDYAACGTRAPIHLTVGGKELRYGHDYYDLTYTGSGTLEGAAVFVGYGIDRPDVGWDDYAGLDVRGKVVVAIRGAPASRSSEFHEERTIGYKSSRAADKGAAGFLLVQDDEASTGTIQERYHRGALPALWVSGTVADGLLAPRHTTLAEQKRMRDEGLSGQGFATGVRVRMEVHADFRAHAKGHNALGALRGRDPDLRDEVVLVGAHMDHLGVGPDGQVFHGADDNASGTAVLVHLADVLTHNRLRPRRTIVFCAFGAEEQGLVGSKALAARLPFPGHVVCVLNMDMVGQGEPVVSVAGGGDYPRMQARLASYLPPDLADTVVFSPRTGANSDQWPFHERGLPAFAVSTRGKHPNYHTPQDVAANVRPACLQAAARVVGTLLVHLALAPEPLGDPDALPAYLLRAGPRFERAPLVRRADGFVLPEAGALAGRGASGLVLEIPDDVDPKAAWDFLAERESEKGAPWRLVRRSGDVQRAWRQGRVAVLPRLACRTEAGRGPGAIAALAALGYRYLAPWQGDARAPAPQPATVAAACRAAHVLPSLDGLPPDAWAGARKALGAWPAVAGLPAPEAGTQEAAAGRDTLFVTADLARGTARATTGAPTWVVAAAGRDALPAIRAWLASDLAARAAPGEAPRRALRDALGGRLVRWLARTER